ncbi:translocating chain-associated membrane protein 1-like isoform X1 [Ruditapes philippinarum]|uniref:translocating chain-associated membrane protein 1-like isoform X1 n=1 Tax=Ruditapes philippinarum TaxID=129788 RepID=UPI00295BB261|nr:translocating chain-associated membrane protein 1-like isoform X1 [Ruditapes philippinarum]
MGMRRGRSNKNPPVFSHEFVIQNHADITSCVAMVFVIGLMFQATSPVASLFVTLQHNVTINGTENAEPYNMYTCGIKDLFTVFFYLLIAIIAHAVVQEYVLDKLNRKMHLSKVKHSKFNESGQLMTFYFASAAWGIDTIMREGFHSINQLWQEYPHNNMPFMLKFYFIIQMAYWVHNFPELYFQKVKKDEMQGRIQYTVLYLVFIVVAYSLNFTRVALLMMVLHYIVESVFHLARLVYFADKLDIANHCFMVFNVLFVLVRLGTITLAVLTFWYGLQQSSQDSIDVAAGNFNTRLVRITCLTATCLLQAWMMWNFITFHLKRIRERTVATRKLRSPTKKKGKAQEEDISSLPEVDQNTAQNGLRARKSKK